jgi:hypothetical protein
VAKDLYGERIEPLRIPKTGDQSTLGMGVPSMDLRTAFSDEVVMREVGRKSASYHGWWYHSAEDTMDKVDTARLEKAVKAFAILTLRFTNSDLIPLDHSRSFNVLRKTIEEWNTKADKKLDLTPITSKLPALEKELKMLERRLRSRSKRPRTQRKLNSTLMRLSRIFIPILYTYDRWKYSQDPYGLTYLGYPIPSLQGINQLIEINEDTDEFKMWQTKLKRNVNQIADEVQDVIDSLTSLERSLKEK